MLIFATIAILNCGKHFIPITAQLACRGMFLNHPPRTKTDLEIEIVQMRLFEPDVIRWEGALHRYGQISLNRNSAAYVPLSSASLQHSWRTLLK